MEPGQLIFSRLSQAPSVGGQLQHVRDGQPEVKVYPVQAPEDTPRPYLVYQLISRVPDGSALCELDDVARVQVSIFSDTYAGICTLANAIRQQLHRYETAGAALELTNEFDHPKPAGALCFFRSQDYSCEVSPA
ncbi:DUF3168 domain-containing protein [Microvirga sp. STS02]|uniref:tail completion protein gp17 n=1 Tax=Hymenobacter negativus TaxID=2795026 RepID=UPI0018DCF9D2|nr:MULTISPECIES: DUF3168 domain-containing protein [Bacteria]MBH8569357.1 DUF3168 domain-containing protein [Hymenobacter negativus]MBR7209091.1 DUF3168 domain-containing protein [Microvirga sp. STS02]